LSMKWCSVGIVAIPFFERESVDGKEGPKPSTD